MNLTLLNLTLLALAAVSGVRADDEPPFVLRGSAEDAVAGQEQINAAFVALENSRCDRASSEGRKSMRRKWEKGGGDCSDAWNVDQISRSVKRNYPKNARNRRERSRNRCARRGVDREVKRIRKSCFEDDPSECLDLGEAAAAQIVLSDVCKMTSSASRGKKYEKRCRRMAVKTCQGRIASSIKKYCPKDMPSTSKLGRIGKKCPDEVDSLIGRSELETATA